MQFADLFVLHVLHVLLCLGVFLTSEYVVAVLMLNVMYFVFGSVF